MRISYSKSKNATCFYIIKDYSKNGKRTTKKIDTIGNLKFVEEKAKEQGIDYKTWLNNYLKNYINEHPEENKEYIIKKYSNKLIPKDSDNLYNVGYLFLENIYYNLKLDKICNEIENKYRFKFNLNDILANLLFSRIIYPSSKLKTHELSKKFIEVPNIKLENIYRGLTYLNKEMDFIQEKVYENSLKAINRNSRVIYFDCTNYFFEIANEDDFRKYGISKQHQPNPLVGMGLFLDGDGLPLAMNIYPGNENETQHLLPTENKIIKNFKLENTSVVICTDAALSTDEIKSFNVNNKGGFVITQSLKKLKDEDRNEALNPNEWWIIGDLKNRYNIKDIEANEELLKKHYNTLFYKIIPTETASVKQFLIVTFSFKYRDYYRNLRNSQIERARIKIKNNNGKKINLNHNQNDYRRFIEETGITNEGEKVEIYNYDIDEKAIKNEEQYDGFYGITTNLNDDVETILKVAKGRWEIEESFRIMKSDFLARPVNLSRQDRITAHFLTCYLALLIYRILERKLNYKYTSCEIIECLRNMMVKEEKGEGYEPTFRSDLTDDLHEIFGFRTDFELISYKNFEKIFKQIKK